MRMMQEELEKEKIEQPTSLRCIDRKKLKEKHRKSFPRWLNV